MTTLTLPARCDRAAVIALLPDFVSGLNQPGLHVDGSKVEQAGLAMLQLLASARASITGLRIETSAALREAAGLAGLGAHLFGEERP